MEFPDDFDPKNISKEEDYINPLSDFGFKNLFGKEGKAQENLIVLLNAILHDRLGFEKIVSVTLNPTENKGENKHRKSTFYDVHCVTDRGHRIIVEMQNRWEANFDNRMIYYTVEGIMLQDTNKFDGRPWNYHLDPVVGLAICNFTLPNFEKNPLAFFNLREAKTNIKYGDQLNLVFLHIKEFTQEADKCLTELEKIIYTLTNMKTIQETKNNPFSKEKGDFYDTVAFMSRYSSLSQEEKLAYHAWRIHENDRLLREERIAAEGHELGFAAGALSEAWKIARKLYEKGLGIEDISEFTGLSILELKEKLTGFSQK